MAGVIAVTIAVALVAKWSVVGIDPNLSSRAPAAYLLLPGKMAPQTYAAAGAVPVYEETTMPKFADGPKLSSQPFFWRPEAFQGRAFPNAPPPEEIERDQIRLDEEALARMLMRSTIGERIDRYDRADWLRLERRRRQKRGH